MVNEIFKFWIKLYEHNIIIISYTGYDYRYFFYFTLSFNHHRIYKKFSLRSLCNPTQSCVFISCIFYRAASFMIAYYIFINNFWYTLNYLVIAL
jgi:hypothetical protein